MRILVAGGSGFIGKKLTNALSKRLMRDNASQGEVLCMTRNPGALHDVFGTNVTIVKGDVSEYDSLLRVMNGVDIAYYLVHSMEGSTREWRKFADRDRLAARNFSKAASVCGVKRIVYLGGLTQAKDEELSAHMMSRKEVGEILKKGNAETTIFRAAVILGQGGGSFQMLQYLVERLPVMVTPKWVLTKCQPISADDVVSYLTEAAFNEETKGRTFDIGGPDVLTYLDMIRAYSKMRGKKVRVLVIPFLTPRLSSYWIDLVTPVKASLARPLVDSLVHEATVKDDAIRKIIPIKLKSFDDSVRASLGEDAPALAEAITPRERTSRLVNNKILLVSLIMMGAIGSTYYVLDPRPEIYHAPWLILSALWYFGISFSVYFVRYGTRLGAFSGGVLGWITLGFWLLDNLYVVSGDPVIASIPNLFMTVRNFLGSIIAAFVIASSHNVFHKMRY